MSFQASAPLIPRVPIQQSRHQELKRLTLRTRNQVRSILSSELKESLALLNTLRKSCPAREVLQIEHVLRGQTNSNVVLPPLFPGTPQTTEAFHRLAALEISKQMDLLEGLVQDNFARLVESFTALQPINELVAKRDYVAASRALGEAYKRTGYSHVLLRKAVLIRSLRKENDLDEVELLLQQAGLERNNIVLSALVNCYQEEQDFLSMKRSFMNLPNKGDANRFTRDMCRIPFHPICKSPSDLAQLLLSSLQSSLVDAVLIAKVNKDRVKGMERVGAKTSEIFELANRTTLGVNEIASMYFSLDVDIDSDAEFAFYKHSSAWLENSDVVHYRATLDNFYDFPGSDYAEITPELLESIDQWILPTPLADLASAPRLTKHNFENLRLIEQRGTVTRSAMFNHILRLKDGYAEIDEQSLLRLMGVTRDLVRTIDPKFVKNLAALTQSKLSKLILYLLIARKSKNEHDDHQLRRIFQELVKRDAGGEIVEFFKRLAVLAPSVATYAYEVSTEDFIAKLFHLITSSSQITEVRAALHQWMGQWTGEKSYLDRARTLLIDHQLNKIRNEIDDYRIYVDSARFSEWVNDEILRELSVVLASMEHRGILMQSEDSQLASLLERCYFSFCSNKIFGVSSYLGRRIRHGTFKGHLYSGVISIERGTKYEELFSDYTFATKWGRWKSEYEVKIDEIIRNRLHIESGSKRDGLLKTNLEGAVKQEMLAGWAKSVCRDFSETKTAASSIPLITEYCWRVIEVDLKNINAFLKSKKALLINNDLLWELRSCVHGQDAELAKEFSRELVRLIDEKLLAMYNWFKKPVNVAPKASLSLLYKAVVAEVKQSFPDFDTATEFEENDDIELVGGAYHVLYDSMYVVVYNAAKHGRPETPIERKFSIVIVPETSQKVLLLQITSAIRDGESESYVDGRLAVQPGEDIDDAQVSEDRSGIKKLYQLERADKNFSVKTIACHQRKVSVQLAYLLAH